MVKLEDAVVLVVEDNPDNLFIAIDLLLEEVGVAVCEGFESGAAFLEYLRKQRPERIDMVLLDLQMPHQDGYAVLRDLRQLSEPLDCPIVALTANVMPHDMDRARDEGFNGFLGKPIDGDRFVHQIRRILDGEPVWEPR